MYTFLSFMFPLVIGVIVYAIAVYISEKDCNALGSKAQLKKQNETLEKQKNSLIKKNKNLENKIEVLESEVIEKKSGFNKMELELICNSIENEISRSSSIHYIEFCIKMIKKIENSLKEETDV